MVGDVIVHCFDVLYKLITEQVRGHLSLIEVYLGPLLSQIRVDNAALNGAAQNFWVKIVCHYLIV